MTAHHWRFLRRKLVTEGIGDPMALRSMHALLDVTESTILESFVSRDPKEDERKRTNFLDSLYRPTPEAMKINGKGYAPIPAGFEDGGESAFDLAMKTGAKG